MQGDGRVRPGLTIGVTAHRDLVAAEERGLEERIAGFYSGLQRAFPGLPLQLMSPLAEGGDQLAARVALGMGIPLIAVLPMAREDYEKDFGPGPAAATFRELLDRARQVIVLPPAAGGLDTERADAAHVRQRQYAQAGIFISEHCQVLLAVWDGREGPEFGGTGQVVHYHLGGVLEGMGTDPTPAGLLAEDENDLVYHIVCSRDRRAGGPAPGLKPLDCAWFSSRREGERSRELPAEYREMLERLQRFALDAADKEARIARNTASLLDGVPPLALPSAARLTDGLFQLADGLAVHYQRRVNLGLLSIHGLAVLMGMVFLLYSEYDGPAFMVLAFLALFFAGVAVHLVGESREWHRKYLDYRTLAEGLRVQLYWNLAGVVDSSWAGFAYDNFLQKQDVDVGWIRHVMREASLHRVRGEVAHPGWVDWVVARWIGEPLGGEGQLAYYSRRTLENSSRFRRTRLLGNLCLWAGILIAVVLFLQGGQAAAGRRNLLMVLMGALPLIAGIWDAYSHKKADKELIKQYRFMSRVFLKARKLVDDAPDLRFRRRVLRALGEAALDEGAEWLLMHRERPPEHGRL